MERDVTGSNRESNHTRLSFFSYVFHSQEFKLYVYLDGVWGARYLCEILYIYDTGYVIYSTV